jgi:hypothetical protein
VLSRNYEALLGRERAQALTLGGRAVRTCKKTKPELRVAAGIALAASLTLAACGTGSILDTGEQGAGPGAANGEPDVERSTSAAVVDGGARDPSRVFRNGKALAGCDPSVANKIGNTPLRRLSNLEYDNTIRDAFGLTLDPAPASKFPQDGLAGPFASNAKGSVSEMLLYQLEQASERIGMEVAAKVDTMVPCAAAGDQACARMFIEKYGSRAYRRKLEPSQVDALLKVYDAGATGAMFADGINYTVQAMLMAPAFLYHLETKPKGASAPLTQFEMAERLSYFIWGSIPDDELMDNAAAGKLATIDELKVQAARMLEDPKADIALASFTEHWLQLELLHSQQLPADKYPEYNLEYGADLLAESKKFVSWVLRGSGDGTLQTLLTSNMSFPQGQGFKAYNMTAPPGYDGSEPIAVGDTRAGLITMPASMSAHASPATSPIKRGVFVLNDLLCSKIELPADTDLPPLPPPVPGRSIRQSLEDVTKAPQCMGCHGKINPIGFALEGFDRMGRERAVDEFNVMVDTKGTLMINDATVDGPLEGGVALADRVWKSDSGRNCMIQQVFRFALAREEATEDTCSFVSLAQNFEKSGFSVKQLMMDVILQDSFRFHPGS